MYYFDQIGCRNEGKLSLLECAMKGTQALIENHRREMESKSNRQQYPSNVSYEKKEINPVNVICIIVFTAIVAVIAYLVCRCEKKKRATFRNRQPIELAEWTSVSEHQHQTTNGTTLTVQIHRNPTATEHVNNTSAPTINDVQSNLVNPTKNNAQVPEDFPPSYDECMKNVPILQNI